MLLSVVRARDCMLTGKNEMKFRTAESVQPLQYTFPQPYYSNESVNYFAIDIQKNNFSVLSVGDIL